MERDDIIGGLKSALALGESLNSAMRSFINAGYRREEVEAAAQLLNQQPQQFQQPQQPQQSANVSPQRTKPMPVMPQQKKPIQEPALPAVQRVSCYEKPRSKFGIVIVIVLVSILIVLLGVLIGVIFFRENITEIINRFF